MLNILLISGHKSGYNQARNTRSNEGDLNIEVVKGLYDVLKSYCNVDVYPYDRDAYKDRKAGTYLSKYDYNKYNYIFEVHFNSYDTTARGFSVQLHKLYNGGISVEREICKNLSKYFKARGDAGIITRDDLLNMNTALKQGIDYALIEVCFHDNVSDYNIYTTYKKQIIQSIADGIITGFGLVKKDRAVEVINCDYLNLRNGPGMEFSPITQLVKGTKLYPITYEPDSENDYWLKVQTLTGQYGYVWPAYIN